MKQMQQQRRMSKCTTAGDTHASMMNTMGEHTSASAAMTSTTSNHSPATLTSERAAANAANREWRRTPTSSRLLLLYSSLVGTVALYFMALLYQHSVVERWKGFWQPISEAVGVARCITS